MSKDPKAVINVVSLYNWCGVAYLLETLEIKSGYVENSREMAWHGCI